MSSVNALNQYSKTSIEKKKHLDSYCLNKCFYRKTKAGLTLGVTPLMRTAFPSLSNYQIPITSIKGRTLWETLFLWSHSPPLLLRIFPPPSSSQISEPQRWALQPLTLCTQESVESLWANCHIFCKKTFLRWELNDALDMRLHVVLEDWLIGPGFSFQSMWTCGGEANKKGD